MVPREDHENTLEGGAHRDDSMAAAAGALGAAADLQLRVPDAPQPHRRQDPLLGIDVCKPRTIALRYARSWLLLDALPILPLDYALHGVAL